VLIFVLIFVMFAHLPSPISPWRVFSALPGQRAWRRTSQW
jgi:hypothetical protein